MFAFGLSLLLVATVAGRCGQALHAKNYKCLESPTTMKKVADAMPTCAESVKTNIIEEAFTIIRYQWDHLEPNDHEHLATNHLHNTARPAPISTELLRHQLHHHVHRLPGQLHQHQAVYPPLAGGLPVGLHQQSAAMAPAPISGGVDPRVPSYHHYQHQQLQPHHHLHRGHNNVLTAAPAAEESTLDANPAYFEYQHFDPDVHSKRRRRYARQPASDLLQSKSTLLPANKYGLPGAWGLKTTEITMQEKRIAGCLLHCIFSKSNAVDALGWPTLDGLVSFFSEGVHDHGYFVGVLRAANGCLNKLAVVYHVRRWRSPEQGQSCDLSFELFNCVSDKIAEFCNGEANHLHLHGIKKH